MNNCYTKNLTVYDINEVWQNFKSVKKKPNKSKPCIENGRKDTSQMHFTAKTCGFCILLQAQETVEKWNQ
jgi:hypothetical protein